MGILPTSVHQIPSAKYQIGIELSVPVGKCSIMQKNEISELCVKKEFNSLDWIPKPDDDDFLNTNLPKYLQLVLSHGEGNHNMEKTSAKYKVYLERLKPLLAYANGLCLDIGADESENVKALLPDKVKYLGIDPFKENAITGVYKGMAEFLPFKKDSFDTIMFNTSLDHILDFRLALENALNVLKPGGLLLLATLVWTKNFELWRDDVHFHHFLPDDIENLIKKTEIVYLRAYKYGEDANRYGLFLAIKKPVKMGCD